MDRHPLANPRRVCVLGSTGTIGRATVHELLARGHEVTCFVRPGTAARGKTTPESAAAPLEGAIIRPVEVTDPRSLRQAGFRGERFDAVISCMASRTGVPEDAWAIDYQAHVHALHASLEAGVSQFVLLSAICVQKPRLAFQHAKLAFERALAGSGLKYTIVRPTAF